MKSHLSIGGTVSRTTGSVAILVVLVLTISGCGTRATALHAPSVHGFKQVSADAIDGVDYEFACAVRIQGKPACWGSHTSGTARPPSSRFIGISVGSSFACGLTIGHRIACWGYDDHGSTKPPAGRFRTVSAGGGFACALKLSAKLVCWGDVPGPHELVGATPTPDGQFKAIAVGGASACGVTMSKALGCWGGPFNGNTLPRPPHGRFTQVVLGEDFACALRTSGRIACWVHNRYGATKSPSGQFKDITAGPDSACGLRQTGRVVCWGRPILPSGLPDACRFGCIGRRNGRNGIEPPKYRFRQVSAGDTFVCGVRQNRRLACWGYNSAGEARPPR